MQVFVQLLITGVAMGFIYALVGIEYTLIWNSTGLLNFSHDKFTTSSLVTVFTTSGPVMNMWLFSFTIKIKSVSAGG